MKPTDHDESYIEQRIWDYLDGTGTEQERAEVTALTAGDPKWRAQYESLHKLHAELQGTGLASPSPGFERAVMERIAAAGRSKSGAGLHPWAIRGIVMVFVACVLGALFGKDASSQARSFQLPDLHFDLSGLGRPAVWATLLMMVNIVLAMAIVDRVIRGNRARS